jgi:hypothetical protein
MFAYEKPFDSSMVIYLLDILVLTLRFGGQGLAKITRATLVKKAGQTDVYKRAFASGCFLLYQIRAYLPQWAFYTARTHIWMF